MAMIRRDTPALRIVVAGEERLWIDGRPYRLGAGRMMLVPSGEPMELSSGEDTRSASFELADSDAEALRLPGALLLPLVSQPLGPWFARIAAHLHDEAAGGKRAAAAEALASVQRRVGALVGDCLARIGTLDSVKQITKLELLGRVEAARAYLDANLHRAVPLPELAEEARLSGFYLARAFRQLCGTSPAAYHREQRMSRAASLLLAEMPAVQVAKALGFATQASFSRAFARHYGVPPGQLARNGLRDSTA
jgi:AraC-like DNA-binding protein